MIGVPPSPESAVTLSNWATPPFNRWGTRNAGIKSTLMVARGNSTFEIPRAIRADLEDMSFTYKSRQHTLLSALKGDKTDGFIAIKDGKIVYERYFDGFKAHHHHMWASSTKSLTGLAAGLLVAQGKLDLSKKVKDYIPELKNGVFADLSVQTVLNMVSAIDYSESYADLTPGSIHYDYFRRIGLVHSHELTQLDPLTAKEPRGILGFIPKLKSNPKLEPNTVFEYHSPNVDVIGWIIARQSSMPLHDFIREHVWKKLQTEHDAFYWTDAEFVPVATGGFNTTLRDFARLGLAVVKDGTLGGQRIFPETWVRDIAKVTDEQIKHTSRSIYKNDKTSKSYDDQLIAYKNFWWVHDRDKGIFTARGVFGQTLYVDQSRNVVIAFFSSSPTASNAQRDTYKTKLWATKLLAEKLGG